MNTKNNEYQRIASSAESYFKATLLSVSLLHLTRGRLQARFLG